MNEQIKTAIEIWEIEACQSMDALPECSEWSNYSEIMKIFQRWNASVLRWLGLKLQLEDREFMGERIDWESVYASRKKEIDALAAMADEAILRGRNDTRPI